MKSVTIPSNYFLKMSMKDYTNYKMALIREFLQNSVDAGSKQIVFDIDTREKTLTVFDDGCGMTKDILLNKLLVLGESFKNNNNSIGAFGHAKLLLYFSWPQWTIETLDNIVYGESHYYKISKTDDYIKGTISKIWIDDEDILSGIVSDFQYYMDKCEIDVDVRLYIDGKLKYLYNKRYSYKIKRKIYDDENVNVFTSDKKGYVILVRQNGLYMFQEYLSKLDTVPIIEIKKSPYEMFLQNRDYFKKPYDELFASLKSQLNVDSVDSFALNYENKKNETLSIHDLNVGSQITIENVAFYKMDKTKIKRLLNIKRNRRLLHIMNEYVEKLKKCSDLNYLNINVGFTNKKNIVGLMQVDNENTNTFTIYINLEHFNHIFPNYRQVAIKLYHTIIHEMSHIVTFINSSSLTHNEDFVLTCSNFYNECWNITDFVKIFRETWKEVS